MRNIEKLKKSGNNSGKKISYNCDKCGDSGWILVEKDGRTVAKSCSCRDKKLIEKQWMRFGIDINNSQLSFNSFDECSETAKGAKVTATNYYCNFLKIRKTRRNSIIFCGQSGSGKTHLSIALAINFNKKKNCQSVYMQYRESITRLKQCMLEKSDYKKIIDKFKKAEILVIDDLFKGKITESDINIVFEIVNYRYTNFLPMIISSEFFLEDIIRIDEGIGSRLFEMCRDYTVEIERNRENNYRLR